MCMNMRCIKRFKVFKKCSALKGDGDEVLHCDATLSFDKVCYKGAIRDYEKALELFVDCILEGLQQSLELSQIVGAVIAW